MRRKITLKFFVIISSCLSLINIMITLKATGGLPSSGMTADLPMKQTQMNSLNTSSLYNWNKIEPRHGNNLDFRSDKNRNNSKNSDNGKLFKNSRDNKTVTMLSRRRNTRRPGSVLNPLQYVPNTTHDESHIVPYLSDTIIKKFLTLPILTNYTNNIMILTPIRNAEGNLEIFKRQLMKLSYPHHLVSVYFGESDSTDNTFDKALNVASDLKTLSNFRDCRVINLQMKGGIHGKNEFRHKKEFQKYRRSFLAAARNRLVQYAMQHGVFDHVLWIDSDLIEFQTDLVQQMLFAKSDVVATSCLVKMADFKSIYDCNSWRETEVSLKHQSIMPADDLVLECYASTERIFLPYLKSEGRVVKLDGVGGCALMVKADCFRSGLVFPEVVYKRHIETEGLAKMASDMGYSVVGLPFVEVFHLRPSK